MSLSVGDSVGNMLDFDTEYECKINTSWMEEADPIETKHGDSSDGVGSHRGGFVADSGSFATNFFYGSMISGEHLSVILLKKYCSQYQEPRIMLSGKLTCSDIYTSGLAKTGNISDSVNLAGKKFILLNGRYNDRDNFISGTWIEILNDDITIT